MHKRRAAILRSGLVWIALTSGTTAFGTDLDAEKIRGQTHREPVTVLQNRYFLKSLRPELGVLAGTMLNESYTDTRAYGLRLGVFWSEWLGFEIQSIKTTVSDTDDSRALKTLKYRPLNQTAENADLIISPEPEVNPIHGIQDINAIVAPFYGKLNLMDRYIVYSDVYLTGGLAAVATEQGNKTALSFGAGQRFYFSDHLSVRLDFRDRIYSETRAEKKSRKNAYSIDFGASYFFL